MHKNLDLTKLGGLYTYQDTLKFMQDGYAGALDAMAAGYGNKWVISGCEDSGASVADGWVVIDGVLMPFVGGAKPGTPKVLVQTTTTKELYDDGTLKDFYTTKKAFLVTVGDFNYSELQRLPGDKGIYQAVGDLQTIAAKLVMDEAVILSGCEVTDIDTGASTCNIAAGTALMGGVLRTTPAFSGTYPVYLQSDGTYNNTLPPAPYVRFNPHTSQRWADVITRNTTAAGRILMFETLTDRFVAGVGRWEMEGFSLVSEMQGRTPLGLWFDGVAVDNVTDANYTAAGNQGGEKAHELTEAELAPHYHSNGVADDKAGGDAQNVFVYGTDIIGTPDASHGNIANGAGGNTYQGRTSTNGDGDAHNTVQPYTVIVFVKRT